MEKKDRERFLAQEYKEQANARGYDDVYFLSDEELAQMNPFTEAMEGIDLQAYDKTNISVEDIMRLEEISYEMKALKSEVDACNRVLNDPLAFYGDKLEIQGDLSRASARVHQLNLEVSQIMSKYEIGNRQIR